MKRTLIEKIINVEILTLANELAEYHLYNDEYLIDSVENFYYEFESRLNEETAEPSCEPCNECENIGVVNDDGICINCFDDSDIKHKEIFQWFIVSDWLYNKLKEQGEPVVEIKGVNFWGRCGCGYSLEDEWCLKRIVKELEKPLEIA